MARVTFEILSRWSDRYEAYGRSTPRSRISGALPKTRNARMETLGRAWEWIGSLGVCPREVALNLFKNSQLVLDQHDGIPGTLVLAESQFASLRRGLKQAGLSEALYYPAAEQVTITEIEEHYGGVVRVQRRYSPAQWSRREPPSQTLAVPAERERREALIQASKCYFEALSLRDLELREPGKPLDLDRFEKIATLRSLVLEIIRVERGSE